MVQFPLDGDRRKGQNGQRARVIPPRGGAAQVEPVDLWEKDGDADSIGDEESSVTSDDEEEGPLVFSILANAAAS